jgi:poly(3-hydroxybutyrate) depolymerase
MSARLAAQRPEVFAAASVHAGNLSQFIPSILSARPMSMIVTVGASDPLFLTLIGATNPIPVDSTAMDHPGIVGLMEPLLEINGLDFQYSYSAGQWSGKDVADFMFETSNVGRSNRVRFVLIEGLQHNYTDVLIDPLWGFLEGESL